MRKNILSTMLFLIMINLFWNCCASYDGIISDHFDGSEFFNPETTGHSFWDTITWFWEMDSYDWPEWIGNKSYPFPLDYVESGKLKITFVNHATMLIQLDSINILTDPVWSETPSPISWLGPRRVRAPGIKFENLPPIHVVLISHDHYDHLDLPTLEMLFEKHNPIIIAGLGVKYILDDNDMTNSIELDWWDVFDLPESEIKINFVPARHNSGRGLFGGNSTLWGGFVIESPCSRIYFAGDTAFGNFLNDIAEKYDSFDLTILPLGNYEKRWFMKNQHMNPDEAVQTHILLNSKQSVGIHYGTFEEHPEQAYDAHEKHLDSALTKYDIDSNKFRMLDFGEGKTIHLNQ